MEPTNRYRVEIHDRFQIELKSTYPLHRGRKQDAIRIEWFFFLPTNLGITPENYKKERFYQDLFAYTRYSSPSMTIAEVLEGDHAASPLRRLEEMKESLVEGGGNEAFRKKVIYELRMLACITRARVRDEARRIRSRLLKAAEGANEVEEDQAVLDCEKLIKQSAALSERVRALKRAFVGHGREPELLRVFEFEDEASSVHVEEIWGDLYQAFCRAVAGRGGASGFPQGARLAQHLAALMSAEEKHRIRACYPSHVSAWDGPAAEQANESYLCRGAHLKKFAQSLLFLSVNTMEGSRPAFYSMNAVAAMLAMFFYLIVVLAVLQNPAATSAPAIAVLVIAYAFKDRIKDGLKAYFNKRMTGVLRDRKNRLVDRGEDEVVGEAAEAVSFIPQSDVPADVLALRERDDLELLAEEGSPEFVMKYQREIRLHTARIYAIHGRIGSVDEILRFSVRSLLYRMDEPRKPLVILKSGADAEAEAPEPGALRGVAAIHAAKVYYVYFVVRLSSKREDGAWVAVPRRFTLVLSRDGIKRIEDDEGQVLTTGDEPDAKPK